MEAAQISYLLATVVHKATIEVYYSIHGSIRWQHFWIAEVRIIRLRSTEIGVWIA